jgi:hypothetical protein
MLRGTFICNTWRRKLSCVIVRNPLTLLVSFLLATATQKIMKLSFPLFALSLLLSQGVSQSKDLKPSSLRKAEVVDGDCDSQALSILGSCTEIDGVCPSTCKDALDSFHTTCSMEGATFLDSPYEASTALVGLSILNDDACKGFILDKALDTADTCQEWATLNAGFAIFECGDDGVECPQFCMDMLDGFYGTCSSTDTYISLDVETGSSEETGVSLVGAGLGFFFSDTCGAYQDTKDFTGGTSAGASSGTSAGASISLFATAAFVAIASVAISL